MLRSRLEKVMKQITKRQLDRQGNRATIKGWLPFELVIDREVIAVVLDSQAAASVVLDSQPRVAPESSSVVLDSQAEELKLSKARQAQGRLSQICQR